MNKHQRLAQLVKAAEIAVEKYQQMRNESPRVNALSKERRQREDQWQQQ